MTRHHRRTPQKSNCNLKPITKSNAKSDYNLNPIIKSNAYTTAFEKQRKLCVCFLAEVLGLPYELRFLPIHDINGLQFPILKENLEKILGAHEWETLQTCHRTFTNMATYIENFQGILPDRIRYALPKFYDVHNWITQSVKDSSYNTPSPLAFDEWQDVDQLIMIPSEFKTRHTSIVV